jgi:hypothetical protein
MGFSARQLQALRRNLDHRHVRTREAHDRLSRYEHLLLPNRINIDTGAFATGRLTCLVLEGENYRFITT